MAILVKSKGEKNIVGLAIEVPTISKHEKSRYEIKWSDGAKCSWDDYFMSLYAIPFPNQEVAQILYGNKIKGVKYD